ncbi:hypothetical protein PR202_gb09146 [Eleusine coracana subsp. coracana]|uniref:Protein phosphatase n=1 Tax=Eleusine coracana subsp. coracana TaxID=191504 RepID=A0AAV5EFY9_ELECO|nr:hypothetical protein QOZ80_2BG0194010 [Eleusine coracana subsp. coracana]GJN21648.1 hypothetical protein PR202_gb09146 [Eleusine coracana subsp. coracana]
MAILMEQLERGLKQITIGEAERSANSVVPQQSNLHVAPREKTAALKMDFGACYVPHHDEDAFFVHLRAGIVAVADGVGGCRKRGADAGAFARALVRHALDVVNTDGCKTINPSNLLRKAYAEAARRFTPGASTAVVASFRGATLRWAYVGDSGFAVFRGGRVVRRSRPQQHRFNCPYQLRATGGDGVGDAAVGEMQVAEGDVVVVGTDGLFDNLFDHELQWMVRKGAEMGLNPQVMAEEIAAAAYTASRSTAPSPYSVESARNYVKDGKEMHYGGKIDDITVVVAYVVPKHS